LSRASIALALGAVASVLLLFLSSFLVVDSDLFHEMALARATLAQGSVPTEDLFAYTPTVSPSVHHEWGTGMILYGVVAATGASGLLLLKYGLGFGMFTSLFHSGRVQKASWEILCLLAPLAILLADVGFTTVRAQMFSMAFLAALLVMLQWDRQGGRKWLFIWLPLYVLWLNLHAGFVVGVVLLGCYWIEHWIRDRKPRWHLVGCAAAMAVLLLANPYGPDYLRYLSGALLMERPLIQEWQPLWAAPNLALLFALSLAPALYAWRRDGLRRLPGWLGLLIFALAAGRHVRHLSLYAVVWMATVPAWLDATPLGEELRQLWRGNRRVVAALCILVILGGLTGTVMHEPWRLRIPVQEGEDSPIAYPAGAVDYLLEQGFEGNVMTPFIAGSFVIWKLHPGVKVSLDGRYEVAYRHGVTEEMLDFYAGVAGWRATLERYPTDLVLVRSGQPVHALLQRDPDWLAVYTDDSFLLFARSGNGLPLLHRQELPALVDLR
jgi:hypothetical protein